MPNEGSKKTSRSAPKSRISEATTYIVTLTGGELYALRRGIDEALALALGRQVVAQRFPNSTCNDYD